MNKLGNNSRSILDYRPDIDFVEPEFETPDFEAKAPTRQPEQEIQEWEDLYNKYQAAEVVAEALLARVTTAVGDFKIGLDPKYDYATIQAIKTVYPEKGDHSLITYDMYRQCKESIRDHGLAMGKKAYPDKDILKGMRANPNASTLLDALDINSADAKMGKLRPELSKSEQIMEPIDSEAFKSDMLKKLTNTIWKKFIKKVISPIPGAGFLPDNIAGDDGGEIKQDVPDYSNLSEDSVTEKE